MKGIQLLFIGLLLSLSCHSKENGSLFQFSKPSHLLGSEGSGRVSIMQLARKGNFGLGTFEQTGNELIAIYGEYYQSKANGRVYPAKPAMKTPFAIVSNFQPEQKITVTEDLDLTALKQFLDKAIEQKNCIQAIHIEGTFRNISLRSLPEQLPAIRLESDSKTDRQTMDLRLQQGSLVGFRYPDHLAEFNAPGYHFHFIDSSRKMGGYVLALQTGKSKAEIDNLDSIQLKKLTPPFRSKLNSERVALLP